MLCRAPQGAPVLFLPRSSAHGSASQETACEMRADVPGACCPGKDRHRVLTPRLTGAHCCPRSWPTRMAVLITWPWHIPPSSNPGKASLEAPEGLSFLFSAQLQHVRPAGELTVGGEQAVSKLEHGRKAGGVFQTTHVPWTRKGAGHKLKNARILPRLGSGFTSALQKTIHLPINSAPLSQRPCSAGCGQ